LPAQREDAARVEVDDLDSDEHRIRAAYSATQCADWRI